MCLPFQTQEDETPTRVEPIISSYYEIVNYYTVFLLVS